MRFLTAIFLLLLSLLSAQAQQGQGMSQALVVSSCGAAALPTSGPLVQLLMNPQGQLCMTGVASLGPPVNTTPPVASGTATVGSTLSCTTGTWTLSPSSYAYTWLRSGSTISGATSATYVTVFADWGTSVGCSVIATNGSGNSAPSASNTLAIAGYVGPGNVVSGAVGWWGLRCYNAAYSGNVVDIVDGATGNTTGSRLQCSNGVVAALVSGSACTFVTGGACSPIASTCSGGCIAKTLYDQSGAAKCSGPCDLLTGGVSPAFTPNCIGSLPCLTAFGASASMGSSSNLASTAQPFTASFVAERTGAFTAQAGIMFVSTTATGDAEVSSSANTWLQYNGSVVNYTANDNVVHAVQSIFNGASSAIYVDGATTSGSQAATALGGGPVRVLNSGGNTLTGHLFEAGYWGVGFSGAQQSSMNANQHAYWGF